VLSGSSSGNFLSINNIIFEEFFPRDLIDTITYSLVEKYMDLDVFDGEAVRSIGNIKCSIEDLAYIYFPKLMLD